MYSPTLGRFLQPDAIGYGGGMNLYGYVGGDPINKVDPLGFQGEPIDEIVVTAKRTTRFYDTFVRDLYFLDLLWRDYEDSLSDELAQNEPQEPSRQEQSQGQCTLSSTGRDIRDSVSDAIVGFGDAFLIPILVRNLFDISGTVDYGSSAYSGGLITGTSWGSSAIALRGAAALGGTRAGHVLNHNPHFRIGPGRWGGNMVPRVSSPYLPGDGHFSLLTRLPLLPPIGGLVAPDGCQGQ